MHLKNCYNFQDFRTLAKQRLPSPIYNYIDGGADVEVTLRKNTKSFERCDLLPSVLQGITEVDTSVTVMNQKLDLPIYLSPTALQRLFHHEGERAVAAAASKYGTMFGVSSLGTVSLEEIRKKHDTPQIYQFYFHRDRGLNAAMMSRAKKIGVEVMMLTVDSITGGNRERDLRTGFTIPFHLTLGGIIQFLIKPKWGINYVSTERFSLPQLEDHIDMNASANSISGYFTEMLDPTMQWDDIAKMVQDWSGEFCLKGVMTVEDAKRAVQIGCTGTVLSNHGGRQLDGSRTPFDQLKEVVDAVGDEIDVMMDGGVQRGTHVLKALSLGAKAVGIGRGYLYALAAGGQPAVERAVGLLRNEIVRDMKLLGVSRIAELSPRNLRFRNVP